MYNKFGIKGASISEQIASQCFTEEQKEILEYEQGKIKVTIADQINRFYGDKYLVWSEFKTLNLAAQIIHENEHLIDEIKDLKEKIKLLKDPRNFKKIVNVKTQTIGCANTDTDMKNLNKHIDISEVYAQNNAVKYNRSMSSEPTQLINKLDALDDTNKLLTLKQSKKKFKFSKDEFSDEMLAGVKEDIEFKELKPESDNRDYHNAVFSKEGDLAFSGNDSYIEHRAMNKHNTLSKSISTANNKGETEIDVVGESVYKSLMIEIPRMRIKFWNKFWCLFKECTYCI